ncbi:MAG: hypothetical protein QM516_14105 [Limnohabitans sp.]|nr:hypothetical protein [Limnohabitans sp.]
MTQAPNGAPSGGRGGFARGFPGGFRVFTMGRDAASQFRVKPPWRVREGAGPLERAMIATLTFLLAVPIALLLLAIGIVLLFAFLGCAALLVAFALAMWVVRRVFGVGSKRVRIRPVPEEDGRENVRVIARRDEP